jgi:hypothetical protein
LSIDEKSLEGMQAKVIDWSLAQLWNSVAFKPQRELQKRDYVYASEIGTPFYDRYLKMKAVPYTNPPNNRSLRKFLAGNLIEFVTKQILVCAGVYRHDEVKVDAVPYSDCLPVHGRLDFLAGGEVNEEAAYLRLKDSNLPDYLFSIGDKIIEALAGKTLTEKILELKAVSTFAFDKVERMGEPIPNHALQAYHYKKHKKIGADIVYICKDDCRMAQFSIIDHHTEPIYRNDLLQMTEYFKKRKPPPLAPLVTFDTMLGKFSKNLQVEYSPYLSHYGFKDPDEYRSSVSYVDGWNRVLNRYVLAETGQTTKSGKPISITPKNKETRTTIEKAGYNFAEILQCKINLGADADDEE